MSKMKPSSIVDTENPFRCREAYIPAGYPSQECVPEICLTHTERDAGEPFVPVEPEPVLLPDCIAIASGEGEGTLLTLTGTQYVGTDALAELDVSETWCITVNGNKFVKTDSGDLPTGAFVSTGGNAVTVVDCENFTGDVGSIMDCVALAFTDIVGVPVQDFEVDATGNTYIGALGGGALTYVAGNWQLSVNGQILTGPTNENDPRGEYEGGGNCALFKECSDPATLPASVTIELADDTNLTGEVFTYNGADYLTNNPLFSTLGYFLGTGWTFAVDHDSDALTDPLTYVKQGDPSLNPSDPTGVYSNGVDILVIS